MTPVEPLDIPSVELSGITLIEASAGTGKTYTLAALYVRLLLERALTVDQILVVTYTRAATAELRVRIRNRIAQTLESLTHEPPAHDAVLVELCARARREGTITHLTGLLTQALAELDRAAIFTIHGFCQRVLQRYAFESGAAFDAELTEDQELLLEEVVGDFWASRMASADATFAGALATHKLTVESLLRFVQRALPNPALRLLPEAPGPAAFDASWRAFLSARARAAQLWATDRAALIELLLQPGLNKRTLSERAVRDQLAPALDELAGCHPLRLPKRIACLTPAGLAACCNKGKRAPEHAFFAACEALIEAAALCGGALNLQVQAFMHELLHYARSELATRAEARGLMGFEDLLLRLYAALRGERGPGLIEVLRSTYRAALIDEFQDTDPVQLEVFRRIYAGAGAARAKPPALFLIGDPKQAIYAFRGADIFAYLAASQQTIDRVRTLAVNYRSDPSLLAAIGQIFGRAQRPFVFEEISFRHVDAPPGAQAAMQGPALEFLYLDREAAQQDRLIGKSDAQALLPARVAAEIAHLLDSGAELAGAPVAPGQIAVLCRTNAQAGQVQGALRELGIPAVLDGDASVFDSAMAEELGRWLWAMAEPGDGARVRAALASTGLGLNADDLLALERDEALWDGWVVRFHAYQHAWQTRGFLSALHALCEQLGVPERLLVLPDGERRYTDLWHLAELLHEEEQRSRKGPRALLDFYRRVREGAAQREGMALEDVQVRLESDAHAVTLTTIHKSKGLEYPIVYCPYLWSAASASRDDGDMPLFHDRQAQDGATLVLPGASPDMIERAKAGADREALAEGTRLLYVALTRAKHRLYVVWGGLSGVEASALGYLLYQAAAPPGSGVDELRVQVQQLLKRGSDAQLRGVLEQLRAAAPEAIGLRALRPAEGAPRYDRSASRPPELQARSARFPLQPQARVGSFSGLVERERWSAQLEPEPLDRDALGQAETTIAPAPEWAPEWVLQHASPRVALADFPAGASFGHLIHGIYERADFQALGVELLRPVVAQSLADYGADGSWELPLAEAVHASFSVPLSAAGGELPSLAVVPRAQRLNELEFVFPVAEPADQPAGAEALSAQRLGQLLGAHARDADERAYAAQLARLRFAPLRGFLRGFIDLALEHGGRFYVIDYKSNRLGETAADYQRARMLGEMRRHHYVLQYLIYCVAVHRYLGLRLPGYEYERHFGGVYYLFIRGMSPAHPPGTGVLFERPPGALIEQLSALLRQPELLA